MSADVMAAGRPEVEAALLLLTIMAASFVGISRLGYDEFALIRRGD